MSSELLNTGDNRLASAVIVGLCLLTPCEYVGTLP